MSDDNDRNQVLYEIAEVFERCGLHPQALYEGLRPLAMEHNRDGLGKMLNSMLGAAQLGDEPPNPWQVMTEIAYALDGTADISLADALNALAEAFPARRRSDPGLEADAVARFVAALRQHWAVGGLAVAADRKRRGPLHGVNVAAMGRGANTPFADWLRENGATVNGDDGIPF